MQPLFTDVVKVMLLEFNRLSVVLLFATKVALLVTFTLLAVKVLLLVVVRSVPISVVLRRLINEFLKTLIVTLEVNVVVIFFVFMNVVVVTVLFIKSPGNALESL